VELPNVELSEEANDLLVILQFSPRRSLPLDIDDEAATAELIKNGLACVDGNRIVLTDGPRECPHCG
jgi:hypothetical protein